MNSLTFNDFIQHTGSDFTLDQPAGIKITLKEAKKGKTPAEGFECFTLELAAPLPALPQAIYTLKHEQLGDLQLFLVPVAQKDEQIIYQAVFNIQQSTMASAGLSSNQ